MKKLLQDIILHGNIPYRFVLQKIILFVSLLPLIGLFLMPEEYKEWGSISWLLLLGLLALRPLSNIFVDIKIFHALLPFRKEAGILCGSFGIAHSLGYFIANDISLPSGLFLEKIWDFTDLYIWGMIAGIILLVLTITSNIFSIRLLKRNWKRLHRFVYLALVMVALHIVFIKAIKEGTFFSVEVLKPFVPVIFLSILWILAYKKVKISLKKTFPKLYL